MTTKKNTVPWRRGKSLSLTAVNKASYPIPGHPKIISITNAPFNHPENSNNAEVRGVIKAFLLNITFDFGFENLPYKSPVASEKDKKPTNASIDETN